MTGISCRQELSSRGGGGCEKLSLGMLVLRIYLAAPRLPWLSLLPSLRFCPAIPSLVLFSIGSSIPGHLTPFQVALFTHSVRNVAGTCPAFREHCGRSKSKPWGDGPFQSRPPSFSACYIEVFGQVPWCSPEPTLSFNWLTQFKEHCPW